MGKLTALSPLIGSWSTTITMLSPAGQNGLQFHVNDTYRWLPGENIVVHDVIGEMDGKPVVSMEVYSCDDMGQVHARSYDSGGEVSDFRAAMQDGKWTIDGDTQRFASTAVTRDAIEGLWQTLADGDWLDWMRVSLHRQS
jgi:hypothetical protein